MQYGSKLVPKTIRDIYTYTSISFRIRITNILLASWYDSVSTLSHIENIATFQTLKSKIDELTDFGEFPLFLFRKSAFCYFNATCMLSFWRK